MPTVPQRFIVGTDVYDTQVGQRGSIIQMNIDTSASLANPYTTNFSGPWFVTKFVDGVTLQMYTVKGQQINHTTGSSYVGVTLLTWNEYNAVVGAGYPTT